jgi:hypothetical protein
VGVAFFLSIGWRKLANEKIQQRAQPDPIYIFPEGSQAIFKHNKKHNTICNTVQLYRTLAICLNFKLFAEA